jgi:hypothetical protein
MQTSGSTHVSRAWNELTAGLASFCIGSAGLMTTIDWDDLATRFRIAEQVGLHRYNELYLEHRRHSVIAVVGGHEIRPISTRFGRLFAVGDTGWAFSAQAQAEAYASKHPRNDRAPL